VLELHDLARRVDPIHARHVEVHHDDVRAQLAREPDRVYPVGRLAYNPEACGVEQLPEPLPKEGVILR
jgi:hypothetical protein